MAALLFLAPGARAGVPSSAASPDSSKAATPARTLSSPNADAPLRLEPGLESRRRRYQRSWARRLTSLPGDVVRVPFRIVERPLQSYVIRNEPVPPVVHLQHFLATGPETGVSLQLGGLKAGSGIGGGVLVQPPVRLPYGTRLELFAGGSQRRYVQYAAGFDSLRLGRLHLLGRAQYDGMPSERLFGIGPGSSRLDQSTYDLRESAARLDGIIALGAPLRLTLHVGATRDDVHRGRDKNLPVAQDVFAGQSIEGLQGRFDKREYGAALLWDTRDLPSYARRGRLFSLGISAADGFGDTRSAYTKVGLELQEFVTLPGDRRSLAARVRTVLTHDRSSAGRTIPVFRLETLGGRHMLRGYPHNRFTDQDLLLGNFEYRFPVWNIELPGGQAIDSVVFFDCGTVLPRLTRLQQEDLRSAAGFGFRLVNARGFYVRFDNAWGSEGYRNAIGLEGTF